MKTNVGETMLRGSILIIVCVGVGFALNNFINAQAQTQVITGETPSPSSTPTTTFTTTPTVTATQHLIIQFGTPIDLPSSLDELWQKIDDGEPGYVFDPCEPGEISAPYITWSMLQEAFGAVIDDNGQSRIWIALNDASEILLPGGGYLPHSNGAVIDVSENEVFLQLMSRFATIQICDSEGNGKPTLYGEGVQDFLDFLTENIVYP